MRFDYNRLREMVRVVENYTAYDPVEVYTASDELEVRAPALARELLRLHDELTDLRDEHARIATVCNASADPVRKELAGSHLSVSNRLTRILQGDTE